MGEANFMVDKVHAFQDKLRFMMWCGCALKSYWSTLDYKIASQQKEEDSTR